MDRLIWWKEAYAVFLLCVATAIAAPAQTFTSLLSFDGTDGGEPIGGLVQATNGNLYGMTYSYGPTGGGTVFKITPGGTSRRYTPSTARTAAAPKRG